MDNVNSNLSKFSKANLPVSENKVSVTLRVDRDVLDWFKSQGKGYQTKINSVLRLFMEMNSAGTNEDEENIL